MFLLKKLLKVLKIKKHVIKVDYLNTEKSITICPYVTKSM